MQTFNVTIYPEEFYAPLGYVESIEVTGEGKSITQYDTVPHGETMVKMEGGTDYTYTLDDIVIVYKDVSQLEWDMEGEINKPSISKEFRSAELPTKLLCLIEAAVETKLEEEK